MNRVLVSQRVDSHPDRRETRDALDARLPQLLATCGVLSVPVPNVPALVSALWDAVRPGGILLSGGNATPERDATESALLARALEESVPVFGICHGLQFIVEHLGGTLTPVQGHVGNRHVVTGTWGSQDVNSFHERGVELLPPQLRPTMTAPDGTIEAVEHVTRPVRAIMWHPEREAALSNFDRNLITSTLGER